MDEPLVTISAQEYRRLLANCRVPSDVERLLLGSWGSVKATYPELCRLRDETLTALDNLLIEPDGVRGACAAT